MVLESIVRCLDAETYLREYRDVGRYIEYCKACTRYGVCHSCPPFDHDTDAVLKPYHRVYIIAVKINLSQTEKEVWEAEGDAAYTSLVVRVRQVMDHYLLALEESYPGSKSFFAGTCYFCERCAKIDGGKCRHPEKMRSSLESYGFDMAGTAAEILGIPLQWAQDQLPDYFVLVAGFYCDDPVHDLENSLAETIAAAEAARLL